MSVFLTHFRLTEFAHSSSSWNPSPIVLADGLLPLQRSGGAGVFVNTLGMHLPALQFLIHVSPPPTRERDLVPLTGLSQICKVSLNGERVQRTRVPGVCGGWLKGEKVVFLLLFSSDALRDGKEIKWPNALYPDLHMPFAPSWSLHWAYRDGHLVNLPVSLLVEGDIIALRPGQESFASLRGIKVAGGWSSSWELPWTHL